MPAEQLQLAIVLRTQVLGEADLIVGLLTATRGRVDVVARAARSSRKRFGGLLRPFCELQVLLQPPRKGTLPLLSSAELARDLVGDAVTYPQLCLASHLTELAQHVAQPDHADPELYAWLIAHLQWCRHDVEPHLRSLKLAAEAALLRTLGLLPDLLRCARCGAALQERGHWPADGEGLGCPRCIPTAQSWLTAGALQALQHAVVSHDLGVALALPELGRRLLEDRVARRIQLAVSAPLKSAQALRPLLTGLES